MANWTILPIQTLVGLEIGDGFNLASTSAISPGDGPGTTLTSPTQSHKRNASVAGFDSSPASLESPDINGDENGRDGRRRPVKRACNECRQQKVRWLKRQVPQCRVIVSGLYHTSSTRSSSQLPALELLRRPAMLHIGPDFVTCGTIIVLHLLRSVV
jgi:hypothetical protein